MQEHGGYVKVGGQVLGDLGMKLRTLGLENKNLYLLSHLASLRYGYLVSLLLYYHTLGQKATGHIFSAVMKQ